MSQIRFEFRFYPVKADLGNFLANATCRVFVGNVPFLSVRSGKVIQGKNGVFFSNHSEKIKGPDGADKYIDTYRFFPMPFENSTEESNETQRAAFEATFVEAWENFKANGNPGENARQGGASNGAVKPAPAAPKAASAALPPGWQSMRDPDTGDTFYVSPEGNSQWEAPAMPKPAPKAPPKPAAPKAPPKAPAAPAKAGAGKPNAPFSGSEFDLEPPQPE